MSRHHLPLYQATYLFAKNIYRIKLKLPKVLKHDLGQEAFGSILKVVKCVALASRSQEKIRLISRLLAEIEVQWVFLRLLAHPCARQPTGLTEASTPVAPTF